MRVFFILIVIGALGYLGYTHKDELLGKISEIQQGQSAPATPDAAPDPMASSPGGMPPGPSSPATPAPKRLAPAGIFYVTERVAVQQETGIKALNPGEEVKLMYHNKDGTARVSVGKYDFVVQESQLTNDLDLAQKLAASAPRP